VTRASTAAFRVGPRALPSSRHAPESSVSAVEQHARVDGRVADLELVTVRRGPAEQQPDDERSVLAAEQALADRRVERVRGGLVDLLEGVKVAVVARVGVGLVLGARVAGEPAAAEPIEELADELGRRARGIEGRI
jgi:hypothetical protein